MPVHQELHEERQVGAFIGPQQQMKVVAHDAIGEDSHWDVVRNFCNDREECAKVARLEEHRLAMIAAIDNVLYKTVGRHATMSRHATTLSRFVPSEMTGLPLRPKWRLSPFFAEYCGCPLFGWGVG
jgi:hypothetical protein